MRMNNNQQLRFPIWLRSSERDWGLPKDFTDFIFPETKNISRYLSNLEKPPFFIPFIYPFQVNAPITCLLKTSETGFLMFSGGTERKNWPGMDKFS